MTDKLSGESETLNSLIKTILEQTINIYQCDIKPERAQLHQLEYQQEGEFSILGHIEILSDKVAGVAFSISKRGYPKRLSMSEAINLLEDSNIFLLPEFTKWFFSTGKGYHGICLYVELIDYLRRLCIDYLRTYKG